MDFHWPPADELFEDQRPLDGHRMSLARRSEEHELVFDEAQQLLGLRNVLRIALLVPAEIGNQDFRLPLRQIEIWPGLADVFIATLPVVRFRWVG